MDPFHWGRGLGASQDVAYLSVLVLDETAVTGQSLAYLRLCGTPVAPIPNNNRTLIVL